MPSPAGTLSAAVGLMPPVGPPPAVTSMAAYQTSQILGASPMRLILIAYDVGLAACGRRDAERASRAINELIAALNFDYEEIALGLFRLYEYCLSRVRTGSFDEAAEILRHLKEAWETSLRKTHP